MYKAHIKLQKTFRCRCYRGWSDQILGLSGGGFLSHSELQISNNREYQEGWANHFNALVYSKSCIYCIKRSLFGQPHSEHSSACAFSLCSALWQMKQQCWTRHRPTEDPVCTKQSQSYSGCVSDPKDFSVLHIAWYTMSKHWNQLKHMHVGMSRTESCSLNTERWEQIKTDRKRER